MILVLCFEFSPRVRQKERLGRNRQNKRRIEPIRAEVITPGCELCWNTAVQSGFEELSDITNSLVVVEAFNH